MTLKGPIREAFLDQAKACRELGSPFTAHLCERLVVVLDEQSALGREVIEWQLDPVRSALALRLCGGLNKIVRAGRAPTLARCYPPAIETGEAFDASLRGAIDQLGADLVATLASAPQTNEVARSAVLLGGLLTITAATRLPLALYEIGASAGLNLHLDSYAYELGRGCKWGLEDAPLTIACDWRGAAPPLDAPLVIASRSGADLAPIDPGDADARDRLLSYIWPDQPARLARTEAALVHAASQPMRVEQADAADWVEDRLARVHHRDLTTAITRVLLHSISWQYFPIATQERITAAMWRAGAWATPEAPLAWLRLEPDGMAGSAAILLTLWPGAITRTLGRGDYHGRFADWNGA